MCVSEIRLLYYFLPLFFLTLTSGLPPGASDNAQPQLYQDLKPNSASLPPLWAKLSASNQSESDISAVADEPAEESSQDDNLDLDVLPIPTTSIPERLGGSDNDSVFPVKPFLEPDTTGSGSSSTAPTLISTMEPPPVNAPLVHNHTKVPLRDPCNNTTHICFGEFIDCRSGYCKCAEGYAPRPDNRDLCGEKIFYNVEIPQTDPTMIGVVIGLCLMSVTLCVVLRLFAKARFRENRTIFNTPNPRLMNVSLMKGSKQLFRGGSGNAAGQRSRRGSTTSIQSVEIQQNSNPLSPQVENGNDRVIAGTSRPKALRQVSTDTTGMDTPTGSRSFPRGRYTRQDSTPCNSNV